MAEHGDMEISGKVGCRGMRSGISVNSVTGRVYSLVHCSCIACACSS